MAFVIPGKRAEADQTSLYAKAKAKQGARKKVDVPLEICESRLYCVGQTVFISRNIGIEFGFIIEFTLLFWIHAAESCYIYM